MNKYLFLILLSLSALKVKGQYTQIPDANFEAALVDLGYDTTPSDGQVLTEDINTVTSLNIANKNISNISGIEDFTALVELYANDNLFSTINVSKNTALEILNLSRVPLTELNVSELTDLKELTLVTNNLTELDVATNINLTSFISTGNSIESYDLRNNTLLQELVIVSSATKYINVKNGNNTNITSHAIYGASDLCVAVDDLSYAQSNWRNAQSTDIYNENYCRYTPVSDSNFESALAAYDDISNDSQVPTILIENVTSLNVSGQNISDLTGIKDFIILETLDVTGNTIADLDISNMKALRVVKAEAAISNSLNASNTSALETLRVYESDISSINLTGVTALKQLDVYRTNIKDLDLIEQTLLEKLQAFEMPGLKTINVTGLAALKELQLYRNSLTTLDLSTNTALEIITVFETNLSSLNIKNGNNRLITTFNAVDIGSLSCILVDDAAYSTTNWINIDNTTSFSDTYCRYTAIPDLNFEAALEAIITDDVSGDGQVPTTLVESLTNLNIQNKGITDLTGIADFTALEILNASTNGLKSINISGNKKLKNLDFGFNEITEIDISQNTALEVLDLGDNSLTAIDVTKNTALRELNLIRNSITDIDVSLNSALEVLVLSDNELGVINLSNNIQITRLSISGNMLTDLDIRTLTSLESLYATNSNLVSISLPPNNAEFDTLGLEGNNITSLDLSDYDALRLVDLRNCPNLTAVDFKTGTNATARIRRFITLGSTNLTCIRVDDINEVSWAEVEAITSFNETFCRYTAIPDSNFENALAAYDDTANDGRVPTAIIEDLTSLSLNEKGITNTTGIEDFKALTSLSLRENGYTTINLSHNTNLETIDLQETTNLETVNLSGLAKLTYLDVSQTKIANIDISDAVLLDYLGLNTTEITSLDVSNNTLLSTIRVFSTKLTSLDVSNCTVLTTLTAFGANLSQLNVQNGNNQIISDFNINSNPNLYCVQVDDVDYANTTFTSKDAQTSFSTDCESCIMNVRAILEGPFNSSTFQMNDDLRANNLLPTTSPYEDAVTCDASVFDTTNAGAIVDWVEIQLRNADDINEIVARKSFLLQKNSAVRDADTNSSREIAINAWQGKYYVAIAHRNHLTAVTSLPITFDGNEANVDFTSDSSVLNGSNALIEVINSIFALPAGNVNTNGQIQNTNVSNTVLQLGISGYNIFDVDMNGQVQNADINIIRKNIGKGEQF